MSTSGPWPLTAVVSTHCSASRLPRSLARIIAMTSDSSIPVTSPSVSFRSGSKPHSPSSPKAKIAARRSVILPLTARSSRVARSRRERQQPRVRRAVARSATVASSAPRARSSRAREAEESEKLSRASRAALSGRDVRYRRSRFSCPPAGPAPEPVEAEAPRAERDQGGQERDEERGHGSLYGRTPFSIGSS